MYQQPPELTNNLTLAWLASDLKIQPGQKYSFQWTTNYSFVWSETGQLQPGVTFVASGEKPSDPEVKNVTSFSFADESAGFTEPVEGGENGSLTIKVKDGVPLKKFSIGVGMSGKGAYVVNAQPNVDQIFTPIIKYFVVPATHIVEGQVMDITSIGQPGLVDFETGITTMYATLTKDNKWVIGSKPLE